MKTEVFGATINGLNVHFKEIPTMVPLELTNEGIEALAHTAINLSGYFDKVLSRVKDAVTRDKKREPLTPELVYRTIIDVGMEPENPALTFTVLSTLDTDYNLLVPPWITTGELEEKLKQLPAAPTFSVAYKDKDNPPPWSFIMAKIILADPENQDLLNAATTHIFPQKKDYYQFSYNISWEESAGDTKNQAAAILAKMIDQRGLNGITIEPRWPIKTAK